MMSGKKSDKELFIGPIEKRSWPEKLVARVAAPGSPPRIHGYDVEADLACHYSFAETTLLTLVGELPDRRTGRAFEVALQFLAPVTVAEAPSHAAGLAKLCRADTTGTIGIAAVGLAEQARCLVSDNAPLLAWLKRPEGRLPECAIVRDDRERESVARLKSILDSIGFSVPDLLEDMGRDAALLCVLYACGLRHEDQLVSAIVMTRLVCVAAEAHAVEPLRFKDYAMNLPPFRYEEES